MLPATIGIIPARAGFTKTHAPKTEPSSDHPRSRGVYAPNTRNRVKRNRIIPARAGFTTALTHSGRMIADHPRSRGVYGRGFHGVDMILGSSPLARGLPSSFGRPYRHNRIIPARAGFTTLATRSAGTLTDHPRSRGVYEAFASE